MNIYIVAAHGQGGEIGRDRGLPWPHCVADLGYFAALTTRQCPLAYARSCIEGDVRIGNAATNVVVMGRRTADSIPCGLPGREVLTITRDPHYPGVCAGSMDAALRALQERRPCSNVFVAGGADVYRAAMRAWPVSHMFLTEVAGCWDADTYFPGPANGWRDALCGGPWNGGDRGESSWHRIACGAWQGRVVRHRFTIWAKREEV